MKYPISNEFGLYRYLRAPISRPLLPLINIAIRLLPKKKHSGLSTRRVSIPASDNAGIRALLMEPDGLTASAPCLVYCHGGGFVMESAPNHYALAALYALGARCKVLFIEYRLAPKHPFPTPFNDCFCAYEWVLENAQSLRIDPARIAVGGDSAGGCLAAALALAARDRGVAPPCFQLLIYPVLGRRMQTPSMREFTHTPMWNATLNRKMWRWYLPDAPQESISYASPMEAASLAELSPAYIETAEYDCLRDEAVAYASALQSAGCQVELVNTRGTMHGFDAALKSPTVKEYIAARINALALAFKVADTVD